jgi:DNA repair exonuclease SbcCD ATPase subunit
MSETPEAVVQEALEEYLKAMRRLKQDGRETHAEAALEALASLRQRQEETNESNQIWQEVSADVCKAAGVDFLVRVPDAIASLRTQLQQAEQENERRKQRAVEDTATLVKAGVEVSALERQLQQAETALREIAKYGTEADGATAYETGFYDALRKTAAIARAALAAPPPNPKEAGNAVLGILVALAISLVLWALFARIAIALHDAFGGVL